MDGLKARLSFDAVAYDYDDEYLTIDTDTHIININNVSRLFGVQYDGNSKLIKFRIRNKLSDIQKMQDSIVYINWIDSKGVKGQSIAINKTINNDTCEFAWKVPFDALKNSGVLHFAMSAVITENGSSVINQKWSTQIASVITPDGIYIKSYTPSSEEEDRIAQIYNELSKMINKKNDNLQSQVNSLNEVLIGLQTDIDEKIPIGVNIENYLDTSKMFYDGYIDSNNGNVVSYHDWCYTDFITTKAGATLCTLCYDASANKYAIIATTYVGFYDSNKKFISGYIAEKDGTYNVPKNTSYMRISFATNYLKQAPIVVEKNKYNEMIAVDNRVQYGNTVPTIYDKDARNYTIVKNPYCVKSYDKLYFKYSSILLYKNGVSVDNDYDFNKLKQMFPNNWQGYTTSKVNDCMFIKAGEILIVDLELNEIKIVTRPYFNEYPEKWVLILGYDSRTNQSYGLLDEQYRDLNDNDYDRQRFETISNDTLTKLYNQANPVYDAVDDDKYCFAWLSDNHMYGSVGEDETDMTDLAIGEIDKTLNFDAIFNTGDSIQERAGVSGLNALRKVSNRFNPNKLVYCEGNHDRNIVNPILSKKAFYNGVYRQTVSDDIVWGSKENAYFYRDFQKFKIRVIVLNVYENMYINNMYEESKVGYSNAQLEWLANTALQLDAEWEVIVLTHDSPVEMLYNGAINQNNPTQLIEILESFKKGTSVPIQYNDLKNNGLFNVNLTTNFSKEGTIIGVLSGHAHCDDSKKVNDINYIQIVCAYIDVVNEYSGYQERIAFSDKSYAFDIGIVNKSEKSLTLKRIGYGEDRYFNY